MRWTWSHRRTAAHKPARRVIPGVSLHKRSAAGPFLRAGTPMRSTRRGHIPNAPRNQRACDPVDTRIRTNVEKRGEGLTMRGDGGPRAQQRPGRSRVLQTDSRDRTRVGFSGQRWTSPVRGYACGISFLVSCYRYPNSTAICLLRLACLKWFADATYDTYDANAMRSTQLSTLNAFRC